MLVDATSTRLNKLSRQKRTILTTMRDGFVTSVQLSQATGTKHPLRRVSELIHDGFNIQKTRHGTFTTYAWDGRVTA